MESNQLSWTKRASAALVVSATVLSVLLALQPAAAAQGGGGCNSEPFRGRVSSVEVAQGTFHLQNNLTGAPGIVFGVDQGTDYRGLARSLSQLSVGQDVDLTYCFGTNPRLVLRMTSSAAAVPPAAALVVALSAPAGHEALPVTRVFGDDVGELLGGDHGQGMAFGDVNGDGFDDAILVGGRPAAGFSEAVVVVYGGPHAAGAAIDLDTDGAVSVHGETRIQPTVAFQNIGLSVASGDLDGDGIDDVFVGEDVGTHVIFGRASLPGSTVALDPAVSAAGEFRLLTGVPPVALAAGDLNADGIQDLIADAGAQGTFIVYGGPERRGATLDLRNVSGAVAGVTRIRIPVSGPVSALASGDVNGDGFDDLVLVAQRGLSPVLTSAMVVYGSEALRGTVVDLGTSPATGAPVETRITGRGMNAAACGDFDGDGYDDVLLASANVTGPGDNFAVGEVNVIYGGPALPGTSLSLLTGAVNAGETRITGLEEFGFFGTGLSTADIDGDGRLDLVLPAPGSVPFKTLPETNSVNDGTVYVFRGRAGLRGQQFLDPREVSDIYVFAAAANDRFGSVVAAGGDMDRDGLPEFAATASTGENPALGPNNTAGYAAILFTHGVALPPMVSVWRASRAGDGPGGSVVPAADFGPVARVEVDFSDEDFAPESTTKATLRHLRIPGAANALWTLSTTRTGWESVTLTFHYTDAEIAGLQEHRLEVYRANSPTGQYLPVPSVIDVERNELRVTVDKLGTFALVVRSRILPR